MPKRRLEEIEADDEAALRHEEMANEIENRVQSLDRESAMDYLDDMCAQWKFDSPTETFSGLLEVYLRNYDVDASSTLAQDGEHQGQFKHVEEQARAREMEVVALYHRLRELGLLDNEDVHSKIKNVMETVYLSKKIVFLALQGKLVERRLVSNAPIELDDDLDAQLGSWSLRFRWLEEKNLSDVQKLLLFLLDAAMEMKLKKQGQHVFEPIIVDGYKTHAYKKTCEIEDFVYAQTSKELQLEQWMHLTAGANHAKAVVEYLTKTNDYQFRKLVKDRHVFAFRNGVYLADIDKFHRFDSGETLPDRIVAAKYFDVEFEAFDTVEDWYDIPTPSFESILTYQRIPPEVIRWIYVFIGRLLYDVGEQDGWQVIPFFKGIAGSGKSTIVNFCRSFYDAVDVGILSNNIEKKFGISAFHDKFLFIGPEIKADLAVDQAEFQSMITGEPISVAVKHKTAFSAVWRPPGILAGNEVPSWADNSGSIQRRVIIVNFEHAVTTGDMRLAEKLDLELPKVMLKCNKAYLEAVKEHGSVNIWSVLPPYFKTTRDELAQATNAVEAFLASSEVVLNKDIFCPFDEFKTALKAFEIAMGFRPSKMVMDLFRGPFQKYSIKKVRETRTYRGRTVMRDYLCGVDIADQTAQNDLG